MHNMKHFLYSDSDYICTNIWKFTVLLFSVAPLLLVERSVRRITGTLGTTTRLRCSASVEPHDTSFRITWYKDGKRVVSFGRAKVSFLNFLGIVNVTIP